MEQHHEDWRGGRKVIAVLAIVGVLWYGVSGRFTVALVVVLVAVLAVAGNWFTARYAAKRRRDRDASK